MREGTDLFFAPGIRFEEVDLDSVKLATQYRTRIDGFYLEPVRICIDHGHAFAAGLLLLSTIDFMAGLHHSAQSLKQRKVGEDFREFALHKLKSFNTPDLSKRLYYDFRNGLTHEARIKNAGEFSFDPKQTLSLDKGRASINPQYLLAEVEAALAQEIDELTRNETKRRKAADRLRSLFTKEFASARTKKSH